MQLTIKKIFFFLLLLIANVKLSGQNLYTVSFYDNDQVRTIKRVNYEPYIGVTFPMLHMKGYPKRLGPTLGFEVRINMDEQPIDFGFQVNVAVAVRKFDDDDLALRNVSTSVTFDYNWFRGRNVTPFVGASLGTSYRLMTAPYTGEDYWGTNDVGGELAIRGGFLFFHHLRTTLECRITNKRYNVFAFRIGYAF